MILNVSSIFIVNLFIEVIRFIAVDLKQLQKMNIKLLLQTFNYSNLAWLVIVYYPN